jgi:hypothetical protein
VLEIAWHYPVTTRAWPQANAGDIITAMTPHRWFTAGWVSIALMVVLAVVSAVLTLDAVAHGSGVRPLRIDRVTSIVTDGPVTAGEFLGGLICAVLAGVAFFSGIACFFWGALLDSRQQMARLLASLPGRKDPA